MTVTEKLDKLILISHGPQQQSRRRSQPISQSSSLSDSSRSEASATLGRKAETKTPPYEAELVSTHTLDKPKRTYFRLSYALSMERK